MRVKEDTAEIKIKYEYSVSSLLSSTRSWGEVKSMADLERMMKKTEEDINEKLEELAEFDHERWKKLIKRKVVDKNQGHKKTMSQLQEHFEFTDEERSTIEAWIEIYRRVRLKDESFEQAKRVVVNDMDPKQSNFVDKPQTKLGEVPK